MAENVPHNMFKDVNHIIKIYGDTEQLSLKTMLDAPNGQVLTFPISVI